MSNWRSVDLGDLVELQRGYDLPTSRRRLGRVPVVGAGGVSGWHDTPMVRGPGIVVGRAGASMGKATYVCEDFWPLNTSLFVKSFRGNDPRFLYYMLTQIDFSGYNSGAAHPMLNRNYIKQMSLRVPSYVEQRAIARLLGALDDKIALNNRVADTGRELGKALFYSASRDGEDRVVGDLAEIFRGVAPQYSFDEASLLVLNQRCVRRGKVSAEAARRTTPSRVPVNKLLRVNDVLVNSTGVGTLGRVALWREDTPCTVDSHITIVRFDPAATDQLCAGFAMLAAQPEIERLGEGSTGQTELSRAKLAMLRVRIPSRSGIGELRRRLHVLEATGAAALTEASTTARLRDVLLPGLMSGEIRVRDAERAVEEAT